MAYKKIIELTPSDHSGYRELGKTYAILGRNSDAVEFLQKAISIKPDDADARKALDEVRQKIK